MGEIINRCPICRGKPTISKDAYSGNPRVACMNSTCKNMRVFTDAKVGVAMAEWNRWAFEQSDENVDRCISCGVIIPEGRVICPVCEKGGNLQDD